MRRWTAEQKAVFNELAGKILDEELALKLGVTTLEVLRRRGTFGISLSHRGKFPHEFRSFIRDNYKIMTNKEMTAILRKKFPELVITPNSVKTCMTNYGLHRTPEDFEYIRKKLIHIGAFSGIGKGRHIAVGTIKPYYYRKEYRLCIKVAEHKWRPIESYIWEMANGPIAAGNYVIRINQELPPTIDNLQLIHKSDNLTTAAKNLGDSFLIATLNRNRGGDIRKSKELTPEALNLLIKTYRALLEFKRSIKTIKDGRK